ncbi:hypothetical protein C5N14_29865 [Micromonospora sp. MW-13]|nr:hypothetical protein C5N14_29865 [Micromonospora sp. MW-13]
MYAGLPLAFALWRGGAQVHLASLSFSELRTTRPPGGMFSPAAPPPRRPSQTIHSG